MAEYGWSAQSPLDPFAAKWDHLPGGPASGVTLSELQGFSLVQIMARRGRWAETAKAAGSYYDVAPPDRPAAAFGEKTVLLWSGPEQFFALTTGSEMAGPLPSLREVFAGIASLSDQSDGRCLVRISGPRARNVLAKLSSLDFHQRVFPIGAAAATSIDHTNVNLWRGPDAEDGSPVYDLLVFTSFAASLWKTAIEAAAEYGVAVSSGNF